MSADAVLTSNNLKLNPFRERVIQAWRGAKAGRESLDPILKQKTYRSTLPVTFKVGNPWSVSGVLTGAFATLLPTPDNELQFFSYGINNQIPTGFTVNGSSTYKATKNDTNQSKGKNTNGGEVVGIEAISTSVVSMGVAYAQADLDASSLPTSVKNQLNGSQSVYLRDPGSILTPPQVDSPANLENPWMDAWFSSTTFTPQFDTTSHNPLGAWDEAGEGGARSYLKAHGDPTAHNKYRLPDGLLWMPEGSEGSDFVMIAQPTHPIMMALSNPITLPGGPGLVFPAEIVMNVAIKLQCFVAHGVQPNQP